MKEHIVYIGKNLRLFEIGQEVRQSRQIKALCFDGDGKMREEVRVRKGIYSSDPFKVEKINRDYVLIRKVSGLRVGRMRRIYNDSTFLKGWVPV